MKAKTIDTLYGLAAGIVCFLVLLLMALLSGCSTAGGTIDAATTKIQLSDPSGKSFALAFPKELQASGLHVTVDPVSGAIKLDADQLKSSSTSIIESAGAAQAQAMAAMSQSLNTALSAIMPILAQAAKVAATVEGGPAAGAIVGALEAPPAPAPQSPILKVQTATAPTLLLTDPYLSSSLLSTTTAAK